MGPVETKKTCPGTVVLCLGQANAAQCEWALDVAVNSR